MGQPASKSTAVLPTWVNSSLLQGMLRGIERESLRMQSNGFLSQADHPQALGSALTHPHITTDYSEALLEFITPPQPTITEALDYLKDINTVAHRHLESGEKLWPLSMPCMLDENKTKKYFLQNSKFAQNLHLKFQLFARLRLQPKYFLYRK